MHSAEGHDTPVTQSDAKQAFKAIFRNNILIGSEEILSSQIEKIAKEGSDDIDKQKKAIAKYQQVLKELRIRFGTLLKMDNVSFLLGAGCSIDAGGVSLCSIPLTVEKSILEKGFKNGSPLPWLLLFYDLIDYLTECPKYQPKDRLNSIQNLEEKAEPNISIKANFEQFLSTLFTIVASTIGNEITISFSEEKKISIKRNNLKTLIEHLKGSLVLTCNLPTPELKDSLIIQRQMLKKLLTRPLNLRRVNLFTLNYDTLFEQAADDVGIVLIDGFIGSLKRVFRPESFDQDLYFPAQTTEGNVRRLDRVIHLYKLHGSISWHREEPKWENPYGLFATLVQQDYPQKDVVIYPTPLKHGQVLGFPYSEMFRRFASAIVQPQSALFVIGYGFGDEHVIALIRQALSIPSFTLVIIDPNPQSAFVKQLEKQQDQRVWIVKGDSLGTFSGFVKYLLPDLQEEKIIEAVMKTYNALSPSNIEKSTPSSDNPDE
ncbi:MAG TPA: SIR2 family protein [archaeon]|nr:SIR2 family protein [archaeon]